MKVNVQSAPSQIKTLGFIAAAMLLSVSQSVWAVGTTSNTDITNLAKLSYSVGATAQPEICSSSLAGGNSLGNGGTTGTTCASGTNGALNTTFKVDKKVNVLVAEVGSTPTTVVAGQLAAVTTFTVTNLGNDPQDFSLTAANLTGNTIFNNTTTLTDNFDATGCSAFVENGLLAGYTASGPNQDTATFIDELAANGVASTATVYVVCNIPTSQPNNDVAVVSLTATAKIGGTFGGAIGGALTNSTNATANTAGVDTVFADLATTPSADGTRPLQTAADASGVAHDAYLVQTAILSVAKTVTLICDPINGPTNPKNIPGAAVQYAITVKNTGAAAATLSQISDAISTSLAFDPKLNSGALPVTSCVSGNGANTLSATGFGAKMGAGIGPGVTAPGVLADATSAGASIAGVPGVSEAVTVDFLTLATSAIVAPAAATLAPASYITVYFNAFIQ